MATRKQRGQAGIAGFDPFLELLDIAIERKRKWKAAKTPKTKDKREREVVEIAFQLMPYCKPKLNAVTAQVDASMEIVVQIGGTDEF